MYSVTERINGSADLPPELASYLPYRLWNEIKNSTRLGRLEEIRVRADRCSSLIRAGENIMLGTVLTPGEVRDVINAICKGSLYAYSDMINQGYISVGNGVRVGVCGRASCEDGKIIGVYDVTSLCIRLPHRHTGVGRTIAQLIRKSASSRGVLIYSPPGVGKTTLLRGVAAELAGGEHPMRVVVIDTRGELGFEADDSRLCLDILSGYPREQGIEIASRTMNAQVIICDEIGDFTESMALVSAHNCGIPLVASAHASNCGELLRRTGIRLLHDSGMFGTYAGIARNGSGGFIYDMKTYEEADKCLKEETDACT